MLAMVPWIASHDGPTVDEICERFQVSRRKLLEDLEVLSLVGVPPYTPDTLIEVTIEGDRVWLRFAEVFARPLHLTPEQGLALVVAGRASQALPGTDAGGPLATALVKVAAVLGIDPDDAVSVALGETRPGVLDRLRRATTPTAATSARRATSIRTPCSPTRVRGTCGATATRRKTSACSGSTASTASRCWTRRSHPRTTPTPEACSSRDPTRPG
jgi:proteasome accessory factor C